MKTAHRLETIHPSATLAFTSRAKAMAAAGEDVVALAAGEPDFDTPQFIKDAAIAALREGFTKYTASAGMPELRQAICEKLKRDNHLSFTPDQVLVGVGAKHVLFNFFQAVVNEGDEVIILAPYWVSYPDMVRLAGGKPVIVQTREENDFAPDADAIRAALTPRTRVLVLNSPSNPTGAVFGEQALRSIASAVRDHACLIVTDDIYERLLYRPEPFLNIVNVAPELLDRTLVVNGMSKAFAMTGWRLGYGAGPKALLKAMELIQDQSTSNANSIAQKAAVAALRGPEDEMAKMVAEFKARRDRIVTLLNQIPGVSCRRPDGAFYVFPNIQRLIGKRFDGKPVTGSMDAAEILLNRFKLGIVPGLPFGGEGYLRISFAASRAAIEKGLARLAEFASALA